MPMLSLFIFLSLSLSLSLSRLYLLLLFLTIAESADPPPYHPSDVILINCGASRNSTDKNGLIWETDDDSSGHAPVAGSSQSFALNASYINPSITDQVPYQTARLFFSPSTYSLSVSTPGHKFIRLYFYPDIYAGNKTDRSFFSVKTDKGFTLLSNFSAFLHSMSHPDKPVVWKEFTVEVDKSSIDLTFSPNANSFAFINGIEIVSLPEDLYFGSSQVKYVPSSSSGPLQNDTALETLYRLNVGGHDVRIQDDTGMFRYWSKDNDYISGEDDSNTHQNDNRTIEYTRDTPAYSAPEIVYRTYRTMGNASKTLEWTFPVDSGFHYMFRFHFCELEFTDQDVRVFSIIIDNNTAEFELDVLFWTNGAGVPIFKDYITWIPNDDHHGKIDSRLSLIPSGNKEFPMLNGLEIFKLSDSEQILAAANPDPAPPPPPGKRKGKRTSSVIALISSVIGIVIVIATLVFLLLWWRSKTKKSIVRRTKILKPETPQSGSVGSFLHDFLCRRFSLKEINMATNNFDHNLVIGRGGFGHVYKGFLDDGTTIVAVKRLVKSSLQGAQEFLTEIELLSKLRHLHLVSLIGFCDKEEEMILVYEYMVHGTLKEHLYNSNNPPLTWKCRLQICLGAAKGLHYLHAGTKEVIIHRDVKSTNILLDEKWVAKVSDFGLSKVGPSDPSSTHVTTNVKGTHGYIDPGYYILHQLTDKSDVYSFGVVLLEVLCARPAILPPHWPEEQVNLAAWVKLCYKQGTIDQIVDSNLKNQIKPECLHKFVETAISCLKNSRTKRPTMGDVVRSLEHAMQLQEGCIIGPTDCVDSFGSGFEFPGEIKENSMGEFEMSSGVTAESVSSSQNSLLPSHDVFSELANPPLGR